MPRAKPCRLARFAIAGGHPAREAGCGDASAGRARRLVRLTPRACADGLPPAPQWASTMHRIGVLTALQTSLSRPGIVLDSHIGRQKASQFSRPRNGRQFSVREPAPAVCGREVMSMLATRALISEGRSTSPTARPKPTSPMCTSSLAYITRMTCWIILTSELRRVGLRFLLKGD